MSDNRERIEPIRKQIVVAAPAERAFTMFTSGIDRWWPRDHHIGATPLVRVIIEPRVGGRWYTTHEDGSERDVGRVLAWQPPQALTLTWQIGSDWKFDPTLVTEVELRFVALAPKQTRVELEHRHLERMGTDGPRMWTTFDAPGGWSATLAAFAQAAAADAPADAAADA